MRIGKINITFGRKKERPQIGFIIPNSAVNSFIAYKQSNLGIELYNKLKVKTKEVISAGGNFKKPMPLEKIKEIIYFNKIESEIKNAHFCQLETLERMINNFKDQGASQILVDVLKSKYTDKKKSYDFN